MSPLHIATPLLQQRSLSARSGRQVWLKMESAQPSGSFKLRGIGRMCQLAAARGASRLICPSGGNAGFAAAYAGVALQLPTTIYVPHSTDMAVREAIRAIGAELIVHGSVWDECNQRAVQDCQQQGAVYIPPFDHPDIWDGNASLIDEVAGQADFDVVLCSVGGGGLLSGVVAGLRRNGLEHIPVIAVETEGAASLQASVQAGELVSLAEIRSIATTLGARRVAQHAFELTRSHDIRCVTVSDAAAVAACLRFADEMRTLVEPACGATLAVLEQNLPVLASFRRPLVVVCGGIAVDLARLTAWKNQLLPG